MDDLAALAPDRGGRGTQGRIQDFDLGTVAASRLVVGFGSDIHGWSVVEATGAAAAKVRIHDGRDANSPVVGVIGLTQSAGQAMWFGETGIACETGIYLEVVAGSVEAVLYARAPGARGRG